MKRLWFGGSFNPIHHGHLICARAVAEAQGFDRVVLVPTGTSPHKQSDTTVALGNHRLAMCRLAVEQSSLFEVEDLEIRRDGPSYTIDTIHELIRRGISRPSWLIGADMLAILPTWHLADELLAEANMLLMARPGWSMNWDRLPWGYRTLESHVVAGPLVDISATQIRNRVKEGKPIDFLVPEAVLSYIRQENLYVA